MKKTAASLLALLICMISVGCREQETPSPVLLRIDNRTVSLDEFRQEYEKILPADQNLSEEERQALERSFLLQLIDRELILAEADRMTLSVEPSEIARTVEEHRRDYPAGAFDEMLRERKLTLEEWRAEIQEGILLEKVVQEVVYSEVAVTEEQIESYYKEHKEEFDRPDQVRARQVMVAEESEGQRILGKVRQGESFEVLARENSLSPDGEKGGDLGFFARGEMPPEFDAVVFDLPVGRISDLVKSEYGWHIFLVEERRKAVRLSLEEVREEIHRKLKALNEQRAYQQWLQELRSRASIEIDSSLL